MAQAKQQQQQNPEPEDTDEGDTPEAPKSGTTGKFVVTTDALVARIGKGKKEVQRFMRGHVITLDSALVDVENLLRLKAISPHDGKAKKRTTPRVAAKAAGGVDDPAAAKAADGEPVPEAETAPPA